MIRRAIPTDADRIAEIWLERPKPCEDDPVHVQIIRDAVGQLKAPFGYWVYVVDGLIRGWASLSPMRANPAVSPSMAEYSCYVSSSARNKRLGIELTTEVVRLAENGPLEYVISFVAARNVAAQRMHETCMFEGVGEFSAPSKNPGRGDVLLYRRGV